MTSYNIALTDADYKKAAMFFGEGGQDGRGITFPTIIAERDGTVIGAMATKDRDDMVVAGPILVSVPNRNNGIVTLRLTEAYERALRASGVSRYLIHVERKLHNWKNLLNRLGYEDIGKDARHFWLARTI